MKKGRTYPEGRVPYGKTSSNEDALVALLSNRGLKWEDEAAIRSVLRTIGYYRLTGYLHPFRVKELLADYPEVPLAAMGFPADWKKLALWQ